MATKKRTRTPEETWESIVRAAEAEDIDRAVRETPEEVDRALREEGLDPAKVRAKGAELGKRLLEERERLSWKIDAARARARDEARVKPRGAGGRYEALGRDELLLRLAAAKTDPRFSQPVSFMFRNHTPEEATDEQLRGMLDDLDALAEDPDETDEAKK